MEHHRSTTHCLTWKPQPPPYFQESLVWPPRSYSCSFCKREFRSAQALGGHMNIHRRDRARLKQSPPPLQAGARNGLYRVDTPKHAGPQNDVVECDDFVETKVVCSSERCSSMEDIDLELRLGAPAVKIAQIS